jgi:hypothetical protein
VGVNSTKSCFEDKIKNKSVATSYIHTKTENGVHFAFLFTWDGTQKTTPKHKMLSFSFLLRRYTIPFVIKKNDIKTSGTKKIL